MKRYRGKTSNARDIFLCVVIFALFIVLNCTVTALDEREAAKASERVFTPPKEIEAVVSVVEPVEPIPTPEIEPVLIYDVPLDEELQLFIIEQAEAHDIDPAIIVSMAKRESTYRADVVGDGGNSFGLLQVQPRWHQERMDRLGVTDLLDPYQNVTVAIDYLSELIERDKGIAWALAAYNAGASGANKGYGMDYATEVLLNSETLKEGLVESGLLLQ